MAVFILTDFVNIVKRDAKVHLEKSVKGFKCKWLQQ